MNVIHQIEPGADVGTEDPAAAAAVAEDVTPEQRAVDAFDEGAQEVNDGPGEPPVHEHTGEEAEGEDPPPPGDEGEPPASGEETPEQKAEREQSERAAAAKAEDDKSVKELNLRGKAEQRFRDLSGQVRELKGQLEKAGGEEVLQAVEQLGGKDGLARVVRDAEDQRKWDEELSKIGATAEQFGQAVGYIAAFNSEDPAIWKQARENLLREVAVLDERLGEKTERHDPLSSHADLQAKVRKGELDEADAIELARLRAAQAQSDQRTQSQRQADERARQEQEQQRQGLQSLQSLGAELKQRDGANFQRKMEAIRGAIDAALPSLPPAQWAAHARALYDGLQLPASPPPPPRVGKQPVRQGAATTGAAGGGAIHPNKVIDPLAAWDQGVEEAREAGL